MATSPVLGSPWMTISASVSSGPGRRPASTAAATGGDRPMPSSTMAGWQPTTRTLATSPPRPASMPSTDGGAHRVGIDRRSGRRLGVGDLGLDAAPGCPAARPSARHRRARARRSPRAARRRGARRGCRSPRRARRRAWADASQPVGDFDAEAVVAEEDVADAGDEDLHRLASAVRSGIDLLGMEVEERPCHSKISAAGSSSRVTATCSLPSTSLKTPATVAPSTGEEHVVGVGAPRRLEPHGGARAHLDAVDHRRVGPRVDLRVGARVPPRHAAAGGSSATGRRDRTDRAVEAGPHLGRHVVAPVDDGGRPAIGAPCLGLLRRR